MRALHTLSVAPAIHMVFSELAQSMTVPVSKPGPAVFNVTKEAVVARQQSDGPVASIPGVHVWLHAGQPTAFPLVGRGAIRID